MNDAPTTSIERQLKIAVVGHVDHGKSTLIGRLIHDSGSLPEGKLEQLRRAAESRGVPFEWANLTDALQAERDQNVTIDTAPVWFRTKRRRYVLIDTPGHKEFLKNMVTGASGAAAGLLLIDAADGLREDARHHGVLLGLLGIRTVIVLVNKMDLSGYDERQFRATETAARLWLSAAGVTPVAFIPVATREGDNVATRSARMPWYDGPSVLEAMDALTVDDTVSGRPLRFPIQDIYRFDDRRILAGRIESGTLRAGDRIVFHPSGQSSTVRSIETWSAPPCGEAREGACVGITLHDPLFIERGAIAAHEGSAPAITTRLRTRVFWLGARPLRVGHPYTLRLATAEIPFEVERIDNVIDLSTLDPVAPCDAPCFLGRHESAEVTIALRTPAAFDAFGANAPTGRFVIVDERDIVGAGQVLAGLREAAKRAGLRLNGVRNPKEIRAGCVVWLTGPPGSGKSTIAIELERALIHRGRHAYVLDRDVIDGGLCADLSSGRDGDEQSRRIGEVAKLFEDAGVICIGALILPRREERDRLRRMIPAGRFVEIHVNAPPEICRRRIAIAEEGSTRAPAYEPPPCAEIDIRTDRLTVEESVHKILEYLEPTMTGATA